MVLHANLTLAIARLQPGQLGTYICTATSTAGTARDSLTLRTTGELLPHHADHR